MEKYNLIAAWIGVLLGLASGVIMGLCFQKEHWLGGYNSWERRLIRLGHISFFGIAFLNFAFVGTVAYLHITAADLAIPSKLFILTQIAMPLVCFLAAYRKWFRHLFFIPVLSALGAAGTFIITLQGVMK